MNLGAKQAAHRAEWWCILLLLSEEAGAHMGKRLGLEGINYHKLSVDKWGGKKNRVLSSHLFKSTAFPAATR